MVPLSTTAFEHLANRPPTPPKDHERDINEALNFLEADFSLEDPPKATDKITSPSTLPGPALSSSSPLSSPPSSSFDTSSKEKSIVKRVDFSPHVIAHPNAFSTPVKGNPLLKRLASNKDLRPLKSILKSTPGQDINTPDGIDSPGPDYFPVSDPVSFPAMLESVTKLLASPSSALRLDGYRTLNGALKAYDDLPDAGALKAKMGLLAQFMARDISATATKGDPTEANLTTQALKLATAILLTPSLENSFNDDFQTILIDKSIDVVARQDVSKTIANHHMYLLASQKFSPKIMTSSKAEQLVKALNTIHDRVSGNSVVGARLVIYQRLLEQAPSVMLANIRDWLTHVLHGTLSSIKDIRIRAVDTGLYAGLILGANSQATKAIMDIFGTSTNDARTFGDFFTANLNDMVKQTELATHVPQVWSMVILFFRSKKSKLQRWALFKKDWLLIIQRCMNSKDIQVRIRANVAWNRLIFVLSPDQETMATMDGMIKMLKVPFVVAFEKKDRERHGKEDRKLAVSGYCHLLHYALRPSQTLEELDIYWDEYVHPVLAKLFRSGTKDVLVASRILKALFNGTSKVWNANLANEPVEMTPEMLPRLDSKWVRSRAHKVLYLIGPHLSRVLVLPGEAMVADKTCWQDFLTAIAEAGSQEVRASVEFREALAHLVNLFGRLWTEASSNFKEDAPGVWISRFGEFVQDAIKTLGVLHFSEANLLRSQTNSFEAAPTPSHRPSKHHGALQSPLVYLFSLFIKPPLPLSPNTNYFQIAGDLISDICQAKISRRSRVHLVRQCSEAIGSKKADNVDIATRQVLWSTLAQKLTSILANPETDDTVQEPHRLGNQFRDTVHVLTNGMEYFSAGSVCISSWRELYETAAKLLQQEAGEGAVVLGLMEPTAEALLDFVRNLPKHSVVQLTSILLGESKWPKNRQQMDEGRKALWSTSFTSTRHSIFEPYVHVLNLVNLTLQQGYEMLDKCISHLPLLVETVEHFLQNSPGSQLHATLRKMQQGLASVIEDSDRLIIPSKSEFHELSTKVISLWQTILHLLKDLPSNEKVLKALDELVVAGLNSSHRSIVNDTVNFWNETFGQLEALTYPPNVELALRRIKPLVELNLPSFPLSPDEQPSPLGNFVDSQLISESDNMETPGKKKAQISKFNVAGHGALSTSRKSPARTSRATERNGSSTPKASKAQNGSKTKLRHEDSQIDFTAVPSSSPQGAELESQMLTDHQKEVSSRQRYETAQMYPDFSSSPIPRSTRSKSSMPRLDFSNQKSCLEDYTTPTLTNEDQGSVDDYIGSSPTPKAAEKAQIRRVSTLREEVKPADDVEDSDDIPSSPPQMSDDMDDGSVSDVQDQNIDQENSLMDMAPAQAEQVNATIVGEDQLGESASKQKVHAVETAIEYQQQLAKSGAGADKPLEFKNVPDKEAEEQSSHIDESDEYTDAPTALETVNITPTHQGSSRGSSSPIVFIDNSTDVAPVATSIRPGSFTAPEDTTMSRIEDSLCGTTSEMSDISEIAEEGKENLHKELGPSEKTPQKGQKRKRRGSSASVASTKRTQHLSPLQRMYSWVTGSQNQDDEAKTFDCIVVASNSKEAPRSSTKSSAEVPSQEPASLEEPQPKRGRGRPRRTETPVRSSPRIAGKVRQQMKRNSSVLGIEDESTVMETPRPSKSRRVTRSQDATTAQINDEAVERGRSVSSNAEDRVEKDKESGGESTDEGANSQLRMEQDMASQRERKIAKPKSILERLRSILTEFKEMMIEPQEEREYDQVLFEVRREVHEAASRGRK